MRCLRHQALSTLLPQAAMRSHLIWRLPALTERLLQSQTSLGPITTQRLFASPPSPKPKSILQTLDDDQLHAATCKGEEVLIEAGPGSGKTRVMTARVAWEIEQGVTPQSILPMTYTRIATQELQDRLKAEGMKDVHAYTFHKFCHSIVSKYIDHLNGDLRSNFRMAGASLCHELLEEVLHNMPELHEWAQRGERSMEKLVAWLHGSVFHRAKETEDTTYMRADIGTVLFRLVQKMESRAPRAVLSACPLLTPEVLQEIYQEYQRALRLFNAIEVGDLIGLGVYLLKTFPDIRTQFQQRYKHILVDEVQDMNQPQYKLIKLIKGDHNTLTACGDHNQAIYGWRGADPNIIKKELQQDHAKLVKIHLKNNYRHPKKLAAFGQQIKVLGGLHGADKPMISTRAELEGALEPVVHMVPASNPEDESNKVVAQVKHFVQEDGHKHSEIAILCRLNETVEGVTKALREAGIPVNRQEDQVGRGVLGLKAYLELLQDPSNGLAVKSIANSTGRELGIDDISWLQEEAQDCGFDSWTHLLFTGLEKLLLTADEVKQLMASTQRGQLLKHLLQQHDVPDISNNLTGHIEPHLQETLNELRTLLVLLRSVEHHGSAKDLLDVILDHTLGGYSHYLDRADYGARKTVERLMAKMVAGSGKSIASASTASMAQKHEFDEIVLENPKWWAGSGKTNKEGVKKILAMLQLCEAYETPADGVSVMTVHKAKGLEWPVVIAPGWDDGLVHMPYADQEEEMRLCYTSATRAQRAMVLMSTMVRKKTSQPKSPSNVFKALTKYLRTSSDTQVPARLPLHRASASTRLLLAQVKRSKLYLQH